MFALDDKDYWCIVAIDEDEEMWILKQSKDASNDDILITYESASCNEIDTKWADDEPQGIYKLELEPVLDSDGDIESFNVPKHDRLYEITE